MKGASISLCIWSVLAAGAAVSDEPQSQTPARPAVGRSSFEVHREIPRDPYVPVPPDKRRTGPAKRVVVGRHLSIQVNVDAEGNNILGDAANEPSIAVDPADPTRMAIGWRQFDTVVSDFRQAGHGYTTDGGFTWTFPGVLDPGVFRSDPVLDFTADGTFHYDSLYVSPDLSDFICSVFTSNDGGASWGPPVFAYGGDKEWMCVDRTGGIGRDHVYQICSADEDFTRSVDGALSFEPPIAVPRRALFGTSTVGPDGEVFVAGIESSDSFTVAKSTSMLHAASAMDFDFAVAIDLGGQWTPWSGPNPGGFLGQVWIACDHSDGPTRGYVYVLCSLDPDGSDPQDINFIRSTDGGATWNAPIRVNDDPVDSNAWQWFGTMAVAPNGRIDVIWNDTRSDPGGYISELYYSCSWDAGETWSVNEPISPPFDPHLGWPQQNKLGDYYDMVSDELGARITYAATFNGEQDVYYLRLSWWDCNSNGIDDAQDIASGLEQDCDDSGVPDRCELAAGTLSDADHNGIADQCQPAPLFPSGRVGP